MNHATVIIIFEYGRATQLCSNSSRDRTLISNRRVWTAVCAGFSKGHFELLAVSTIITRQSITVMRFMRSGQCWRTDAESGLTAAPCRLSRTISRALERMLSRKRLALGTRHRITKRSRVSSHRFEGA